MNQQIKQSWIGALRSGEYQQGHYCLHTTTNQFCCLGVLCDLYVKETEDLQWEQNESDEMAIYGQSQVLPDSVVAWAELNGHGDNVALYHQEGGKTCLSQLNDDGYSFKEIADIIEKHL